ncbi:hypothetical protein JG688_00010253 [Phytophthora aleatoria]|uniref:Uncharacterized protein n=1 Tax=Phytophthora aleatoria TaxID=2496075 RepID=A0A8J5IRG4_9STRA|nr:hypothetical protein JG688_00010253 [Phytophthora aleatoria]
MLPKLQRRKHQNRVLRQTLGRIYLYQKAGNLCGAAPRCVNETQTTVARLAKKGHWLLC